MKNKQKSQISHTFAICAYKESPYLEKCIQSVMGQSVKTEVLIATSTPNEYIRSLADKYGISLYIRDGKSDIRDDWNFAYNSCTTQYVTIAHQDDQYHPDYVKEMQDSLRKFAGKKVVMFFSDYMPILHGKIGERDINSKIRRLLRTPMKVKAFAGKKFFKRAILAFGNSICCPAVTYNKELLGESVFTSELKFNIDWDTFYKLAGENGAFAYVDKPLTFYRIHDGATSKEFIESHKRERDDTIMFRKFWPGWVTAVIMKFYKKAYETYD